MINKVVKFASRMIISGVPFTIVAAHAQTPAPAPAPAPAPSQVEAAQQNDAAARAWEKQSGSKVVLNPSVDGGTTIEFHGSINADYYHNKIETPAGSGSINSPLQSGSFYKVISQGDLRATGKEGGVTYVQGTFTHSDDRSVLSRYTNQLTNFQIGRTNKDYQVMLGDVAVNYSQLSSGLGLRGLSGTKQFGSYTVSGHMGVITETWESLMDKKDALDGLPARSRYTRDVAGIKLEKAFTPSLKVYATTQRYNDQEGSVLAGSISTLPANVRASTAGFTFQEGQFSLTGEGASSRFGEKDQTTRKGDAGIVDTNYRLDSLAMRAGYHKVSSSYGSLSQAVPAGVEESYVGADWTATTWMTLGAEYRDSTRTTPSYTVISAGPVLTPVAGTSTETQALTSRANFTLGPDLPGWGLTFQDTHTEGKDTNGLSTPSTNFTSSVTYSSQTWNGMASAGTGRVENAASPASDSKTYNGQLQLGRQITNGTNETPATWTANTSVTGGQQRQYLINLGTSTFTTNYGFVFTLQRVASFQFNSSFTESITTQTTGGPDLKSRAVQVDASYPLGKPAEAGARAPGIAKLYYRDNLHNIGVATLRSRENVVGLQLGYIW